MFERQRPFNPKSGKMQINLSHEVRHFGGILSALVKDARQFKQREKRLLKVVTVNVPLYNVNIPTTTLISCISWCVDR